MIEMRCNMTFLIMSYHWHYFWHHMIPSALSKVPLHALQQDVQNEEQPQFFGHVTQLPLPLASHDATGVGVTWFLQHHKRCHYIYFGQHNRGEVQHEFFGHMMSWHWHQHHVMQTTLSMDNCIPCIKIIEMKCNLMFLVMWWQCWRHCQ